MTAELTCAIAKDSPLYAPYERGLFRMEPGLSPFGKDFGNGENDRRVFQLDGLQPQYLAAKTEARRENLGKYFLTRNFDGETEAAVTEFITGRLLSEHPDSFQKEERDDGAVLLRCAFSGDTLAFDSKLRFLPEATTAKSSPVYNSALDALAMQVQEDLAVVRVGEKSDETVGIHLCFPNHWDPADKVGKDFLGVHAPVADNALINTGGPRVISAVARNGQGFVRFAWGLATDMRLNHHPSPPPGIALESWNGRRFDPGQPRLFVRIERQTLFGIASAGACLFTIRTYFRDCATLPPSDREKIAMAVESMSPAVKAYKGLAESGDDVVKWLIRSFS